MENELKFNSQVCTTKIQSQRLLELGLKPETADMYYFWVGGDEYRLKVDGDNNPLKYNMKKTYIPAWSLHRLIEISDSPLIKFYIQYYNPYEEIISLISECIENNYIDKEYLKQLKAMKTLHLPLKKEWYEMIESGIKTEEYREIKPYWIKRLCDNWVSRDRFIDCMNNCCVNCIQTKLYNLYKYDAVKFSYGYTKRTMTFEIESITIGKGKPEWGAPNEEVFIIKLGNKNLI